MKQLYHKIDQYQENVRVPGFIDFAVFIAIKMLLEKNEKQQEQKKKKQCLTFAIAISTFIKILSRPAASCHKFLNLKYYVFIYSKLKRP